MCCRGGGSALVAICCWLPWPLAIIAHRPVPCLFCVFVCRQTLVPATKILAELAGNDDAVPRLLEDDVLAFVRELTNHGLEEVAKNGIMTIGNVIRSGEAVSSVAIVFQVAVC